MFLLEKNQSKVKELVSKILRILMKTFERENLNIKSWVLGWLNFLINLEKNDTSYFFSEIIVNLILFLSNTGHKELKNNAINLLNYSQKKFMISDAIHNISYDLYFIDRLLHNYVNKGFNDTQRLSTIDWTMKILKIIFEKCNSKQVSFERIEAYSKIEGILLNSIKIIIHFPECNNEQLKNLLLCYNEFLNNNFDILNQILEANCKNLKINHFQTLLDFICKNLSKSDKKTMFMLIGWAEKLFEITPHSFT